jgi:hypothetical protein
MSVTRRRFLKSGATAVLAAGLVFRAGAPAFGQDKKRPSADTSRGFQVPYEAQQDPVFFFTRATFEPYIGGVFTTRGLGGGTVELTLVAVHDWNARPATTTKRGPTAATESRRTDCFSLLFRASGKLPELSTIYRLEHGALGSFNLFMTASKGPKGELFYEAVINHLAQ